MCQVNSRTGTLPAAVVGVVDLFMRHRQTSSSLSSEK